MTERHAVYSGGYWQTPNKQRFASKEEIGKELQRQGYRVNGDIDDINNLQNRNAGNLSYHDEIEKVPGGDDIVYRNVATTSYEGDDEIEYRIEITTDQPLSEAKKQLEKRLKQLINDAIKPETQKLAQELKDNISKQNFEVNRELPRRQAQSTLNRWQGNADYVRNEYSAEGGGATDPKNQRIL
mgnify:CR=1 FL=1